VGRDLKERFLAACGLSRPLRLDLQGRGEAEPRDFDRPFVLVGRHPRADLILDHERISRRHAYFQAIAGGLFCVDLGSRSGVAWEERPRPSGWVDREQGVRVGPFEIRAGEGVGSAPANDPLTARALEETPLPEVVLEFPGFPDRPPWRLRRVLTLVGRNPNCRLKLIDPAVSEFHLALLRTPDGLWVVDLIGRGGIIVNGQRLGWGRLEPGDRLQMGPLQIRIHGEMPSETQALPGPKRVRPLPLEDLRPAGPRPSTPARKSPKTPRPAPAPAPPIRMGPTEIQDVSASFDLQAARVEPFEPMMAQMADRFDRMQERMFDKFEQAMMMMAQMFGTLQRDQMDLVREELGRLNQLNQDLHALQSELASRSPAGSPAAAIPAPAPADPVMTETLARIEAMLQQASTPAQGVPPGSRPSSPLPPTPEREPETIPIGAKPSPPPSTPLPEIGNLPDEAVHVFLFERIAAIQHERQTRWQRVLGLVMGR
jgi:hypothetical protein